jgi:predicted ATPase/DNA-binding SARP family transcriptional activator
MSDKLQVKLFGSVTFLLNGQPVQNVPTRAAQALLVYLLHQPHPVERERLIDMFYQASTPKQAAANLRSTLSRLRKELAPFLVITRQAVGIAPDAHVDVDSVAFAARAAANEWEAALPLYRGNFLAGFYLREAPEFEEWALMERERLRLLAVEGLQKLVAAHQRRSDYWAGLQAVTQLLGIEPLLEEAHRDKMMLLARTGQRPLALQQYQAAVALFETELGIAVTAATTALYERIARLTLPPPCALPARRRRFVGRAAELAAVQQALVDPERRLITLAGAGGMGKTRLAQEVARRIHAQTPGRFLDGIFFVELAAVDGGDTAVEAVATHIAQAVDAPLNGAQPASQQLLAHLQGRELLLILDNFEQLVETAVDYLADLLQQAPDLTLLVTSRERLNLYEETVLTLDGLPTPAPDAAPDEPAEAVQLFLHTVQQHNLNFNASAETAAAIGKICRLLDGAPLAIELAAGWVHRDSVAGIARQIAQSAAFLATDLRNVPPRHRSLRAVFLHSWELLTADLRPVLAALAVFPGRFTAAAAAEIAGADRRALDALVDKSLLQKVGDAHYAVHPLLREFAAEQLDAAAAEQVHGRHAGYFAAFIAARSQTQHRPTYLKGLPDLVDAYDDLLLAWRWAVDRLAGSEAETAWEWVNQMRRPLTRLHFQRNWFYAARALFGDARKTVERHGWRAAGAGRRRRLLHAQLTVAEGNSARILGDLDAALGPIEGVVPLLRAGGDLDSLFDAYNALAGIAMQRGKLEHVPALLDELEAIAMETKRPIFQGVLSVLRSYYLDYRGDAAGALAQAERGLEAFRAIEDTYYEAMVLDGIARRLFTLGRPDEAAEALRRAYALADENDQTLTKGFIRKGLAFYHRERGELAQAEELLAESRRLFIAVNDQRNLVEIDLSCALIAYRRQAWAQMARYLHASLARARDLQMRAQMLEGAACLPILQRRRGETAQAVTLAHFVLAQEGVKDEQRQMAEEALALVDGQISSSDRQMARQTADSLTLDGIVETFLAQGLTWFAPERRRAGVG